MATNLKKEYIINGKTVRCSNRETKADESSIARTFDIILDFAGVKESDILEWAAATQIIRVQTAMRAKGDAFLKDCQSKGVYEVNVAAKGFGLSDEQVLEKAKTLPEAKKLRMLLEFATAEGDSAMVAFLKGKLEQTTAVTK